MNDHLAQLQDVLARTDRAPIHEAVKLIRATYDRGGTVWICGNGGSWATAAHFACDLRTAGIRAIALGQNGAVLTQIANDESYGDCFQRELEGVENASALDCVVGISVSGNSRNVMTALGYANASGMDTVMMTASPVPMPAPIELTIRCPGPDYETTEDAHLAVCHMIAKELKSET
jgi:D-sedoheptulose 7-phosphate isomerase